MAVSRDRSGSYSLWSDEENMMLSRGKTLMVVGMILVLFGIFAPFALSIYGGSLYIAVETEAGDRIEGVTITLVSVDWIQAGIPPITYPLGIESITDSTGKTSFGTSLDGTYTISASMSGFETLTKSATVTAGSTSSTMFVLVGESGEPDTPLPISLPVGYWNINDKTRIGPEDIIYIPGGQMAVEYVCTENPGEVVKVSVKLFDDDTNQIDAVELTKEPGAPRWVGVVDIPGEGSYVMEGYVSSSEGPLRTLTIFGGEDTAGGIGGMRSNLFVYAGVLAFGLGAYIHVKEGDDD